MVKMKKFVFLPHTADVKFQAFGKNLEECFENAFLALREVMFGDLEIEGSIKKKIKIKGKDLENLLYNFLEEFLYLLDTEEFVSLKLENVKVDKKNFLIEAEVNGNIGRVRISNPVKAITYHDMFIKKEKNKYICQVVVDV